MDGQRIYRVAGEVCGTPCEIALGLNRDIVTAIAQQIATRHGNGGVVEFYAGLITSALLSASVAVTPQLAECMARHALDRLAELHPGRSH